MNKMKIETISLHTKVIPLKKPFKTALRTVTSIENVIVFLKLENGIVGIGSAAPTVAITGDSTEGIKDIIKNVLAPLLVNKDIHNLNFLLTAMQNACIGNTSAKTAVEIALYDGYSKLLGLPLYALLGGKKTLLENDMTVSVDSAESMANEAKKLVSKGFSILKIKVGKNGEKDIERILAVRKAVGPSVSLRIDANQGWTAKEAVKIIQSLERQQANLKLVEQPVNASDIEGLKFVKEHVFTPIMADESLFSPQDAIRLLENKAVDFLNIKLMKAGGIRNALTIASIAQSYKIECMIGSMMEASISVVAAAHVAASHPNITMIDLDAPLWLEDLTVDHHILKEKIILSEDSGIGISHNSLSLSV
jgi:o-succinylbenzoate synthase